MGQQGPPGAKKKGHFSKRILDHIECQDKCFLAHFEVVVACLGTREIPKCLQNGPLCNQNRVKNGSKLCFSKNDSRPFGVPKQVKSAHFQLIACHFGPSKGTKCLENWLLWDKKMGQQCIKNVFLQRYLWDYWGCTN